MKKYEKKSASKALYQATEERLGVPDIHLIDKIEQFVLSHDIWEGMDLEKYFLSIQTNSKQKNSMRKKTNVIFFQIFIIEMISIWNGMGKLLGCQMIISR